ncbi:hypothetical protein CC2G_002768 [Coprinopsis cinerea AmutBmut pab1-1]|nr:hypothetical protein CC2G_002768 [Coprinopsis cinerea AmutBmut pab1-1]
MPGATIVNFAVQWTGRRPAPASDSRKRRQSAWTTLERKKLLAGMGIKSTGFRPGSICEESGAFVFRGAQGVQGVGGGIPVTPHGRLRPDEPTSLSEMEYRRRGGRWKVDRGSGGKE